MRAMRGLARGILGAVIGGVLLVGCKGEIDEPTSIGSRHDPLEGDPTQEQCGLNPVEGPGDVPVDACLAGPGVTTIFGPEEFVRETGTPGEFTRTFEVSGEGSLCVRVVNHGMAAARILVDADEVIAPDAFSPNVPEVTASPELAAGEHTLDVRIASKPGTSITVEIRFVVPPQPQAVLVEGENGFVGLYNVYDDPDPFSPAGTDGLSTTTTFGVTGTALRTPGANSGNYEFLLRAYFEVAGGNVCGSIVSLVTEADVADGAHAQLTAEWDGKDADGILQQEGTYYYRAAVELIRRRISDHAEEILDVALSEVQSVRIGDPFGLEGKTTRELNELIAPIKESVENYYDLSPGDRAYFDALARARAVRRSQLPPEGRFFPVPPGSGPRYYPNVVARPVFHTTYAFLEPPEGGERRFWTANLRGLNGSYAPPDTTMVVTNTGTGVTLWNDDCPMVPPTKASCVWFTGPSAYGVYDITVYTGPGSELNFGVADVRAYGSVLGTTETIATGVEFGGQVIDLEQHELPNGFYSAQTVHIPDGADDTTLYVLRGDSRVAIVDDDEGVEEAAFLRWQKETGDRLLVGSWAPSTVGYADLVVNDCVYHPDSEGESVPGVPNRFLCHAQGMDEDADGVSDALELEVGTDPGGFDTDRDGLFDYAELIGRIVPMSEQGFRRLGASPRARDIFIEIDRFIDPAVVSLTVAEVDSVQRSFRLLPQLSANPDGSHGISVHVDVGEPCVSPLLCLGTCSTLCGDWGGHDRLNPPDPANWHRDYSPTGWPYHMEPARWGHFRYLWLSSEGGGNTKLLSNSHRVDGLLGRTNRANALVHEMGHAFNLRHHGDPENGGMNPDMGLNFMAAYPSTMNYAYQNGLPGVVARARFSEGLMDSIDHRFLDETRYSEGVDKTYLEGHPRHFQVGMRDSLGTWYPNAVDWNYDGRLETGGTISFDTGPVGTAYHGLGWPDAFLASPVGTRVPTGGGGVAIVPDTTGSEADVWLFFPFAHAEGVFPEYLVDRSTTVTSAPYWDDDDWRETRAFDGHPDGEVAAARFLFWWGDYIYVLFPDRDSHIRYWILDPDDPEWSLEHSFWLPIPGSGAPSGWPIARQATVAVSRGVVADPADDRLHVVIRDMSSLDGSNNIYYFSVDHNGNPVAPGTWTVQTTSTGPVLSSYFTPGLAEGPDGNMYLVTMDNITRQLVFYRRATNAGPTAPWTAVPTLGRLTSPSQNDGFRSPAERQRLNLIFSPYRRGPDNTPFGDGSGYFAVFWNSGNLAGNPTLAPPWDDWYALRAYTTGYVSSSGNNWTAGPGRVLGPPAGWRSQVIVDRPAPRTSVAVAQRLGDAVSVFPSINWSNSEGQHPYYLPFSLGTPPTRLYWHGDFNDATLIDKWLCASAKYLWNWCQCDWGPLTDCAPPPDTEVMECRFP